VLQVLLHEVPKQAAVCSRRVTFVPGRVCWAG
jgi:hypothetical protein